MDVLIDVGGEYATASNRFDHHQREFAEVFGHGFGTKLSSAGLVYKHFGKQIIASALVVKVAAQRLMQHATTLLLTRAGQHTCMYERLHCMLHVIFCHRP